MAILKRIIEQKSPLNGDYTLYAGLFEAIGSYAGVDLCVDVEGRVWRNTESAQRGYNYMNSSSRDMLLGVLLSSRIFVAEKVYYYLKENKGLLCPNATDNRNKAGFIGMCYLSLISGKGWERYFSFILSPVMLLSLLVPLKKPYELHLSMCTLLVHSNIGMWGWFEKTALKLMDYASPNNAIVKYMLGDVKALHEISLGLDDRMPGDWDDHWPFASYEPWRDKRMAHPSAKLWVELAIKRLKK